MYYNYDEYMREVLGYPATNQNNQNNQNNRSDPNIPYEEFSQTPITYENNTYFRNQNDLTNYYPEIYKMLMPMVKKACDNLYEPVTEDDITKMALEIYFQFEADEVRDESNSTQENRTAEKSDSSRTINSGTNKRFDRNLEKSITSKPIKKQEDIKENREEAEDLRQQRRPNNSLLYDLIRILILNQITGRPNFPGRPPMPPRPPRPPIRPRDEYVDYGNYGDYPYWQY